MILWFMIYDLSLLSRYQNGQETSMRGSDFIFGCVHLLYYKCLQINLNWGGSYIDSPDWIKTKLQQEIPLTKMTKNVFNTL